MGMPYKDAIGLIDVIGERLNPEGIRGESDLSRAINQVKQTGRGTMRMRAV